MRWERHMGVTNVLLSLAQVCPLGKVVLFNGLFRFADGDTLADSRFANGSRVCGTHYYHNSAFFYFPFISSLFTYAILD